MSARPRRFELLLLAGLGGNVMEVEGAEPVSGPTKGADTEGAKLGEDEGLFVGGPADSEGAKLGLDEGLSVGGSADSEGAKLGSDDGADSEGAILGLG